MVTTFLDMNTEYYNKQMQSVLKIFTQFIGSDMELERLYIRRSMRESS